MEGSKGWDPTINNFFSAAGDIQAKPTRVSGGMDLLVLSIIIPPYSFSASDSFVSGAF